MECQFQEKHVLGCYSKSKQRKKTGKKHLLRSTQGKYHQSHMACQQHTRKQIETITMFAWTKSKCLF